MKLKKTGTKKRAAGIVVLAILACLLLSGTAYAGRQYYVNKADADWYLNHKTDSYYEITDPGELVGLAMLVNGTFEDESGTLDPVSFEGKTIVIAQNITIDSTFGTFEAIGTEDTPFEGTCIGGKLSGTTVTAQTRSITYTASVDATKANATIENLGLFGYVGSHGTLQNLNITSSTRLSLALSGSNLSTDSTKHLANIGSLVGYCAGQVISCSSSAEVTVTNDAPLTEAIPSGIDNAGGLAGCVTGNMSNCSFAGSVTVNSASTALLDDSGNAYDVAQNIAGVVALFGEMATPLEGESYGAITHGTMTACSNAGTVTVNITGEDVYSSRWGTTSSPECANVGGVVGETYGSVSACYNTGVVDAREADGCGGVVGNMRAMTANGMASGYDDAGMSTEEVLLIADCYNTGCIRGLHAVGGVAGVAGTYTHITRCYNKTEDNEGVYSYRWNKPACAGIAGETYGDVSFCYNLGDITNVPGAGYYCAGIVGMVFRYWDDSFNALSPEPEIYSNYNAGHVYVTEGSGNWKQAGIVGQNDGYVHDNVLLEGTAYDDRIVSDATNDYGTLGTNTVVNIRELKMQSTLALLNATCVEKGWDTYFTLVGASAEASITEGKPILNTQTTLSGAIDLSTATVEATCTADAEYNGAIVTPTFNVTCNGTTLVQNADFKVIPQEGATDIATLESHTYAATIVGIGAYTGTYAGSGANKLWYGITQGDISTCSVFVDKAQFNWNDQPPTKSMIHVYTKTGSLVDPSYWDFSATGDANGQFVNCKKQGYTVTITAATPAGGVACFKGSTTAKYYIQKIPITRCTTEAFCINGNNYYWDDDTTSFMSGEYPVLAYTGSIIEPTITRITYLGTELTLNEDYRLLYGNPNSDTEGYENISTNNTDITNNEHSACVTARFVTYNAAGKYNFSNFTNMFFDIADAKTTLVTFACAEQSYTSEAVEPFGSATTGTGGSFTANDGTVYTQGVDYSIEYSNNTEIGMASFTVTGLGTYAGQTRTGTFKIVEGSGTLEVLKYDFNRDGEINSTDLDCLKSLMSGKKTVGGEEKKFYLYIFDFAYEAGEGNELFDSADFIHMKRLMNGKESKTYINLPVSLLKYYPTL